MKFEYRNYQKWTTFRSPFYLANCLFWINYELVCPKLRYISYINSDEENTITMQ